MKTFQELLKEFEACYQAMEWAGNKTIEEVVEKCHRGDWLLWLAYKINIDNRKLTLAKGHCANTVRHLMTDNRSIAAVDAAIKYGEGKLSIDELQNAAAAAAYAAAAAAYAYVDAYAAAYATYAANANTGYAVVYAAYVDAREKNQLKTANICRKYIGQEIIEKVNQML